ncbi:hypothetical protein SLEP1_g13268 [Rubroshorea leprosula]|uniref:Uncharacterized protein n=1 Tax=Rubroshorea leprosula TaxID=152421 RepID=A0AAV5IPQ2_9ROSI|nr:hypothetical protein SLEP1_g13268 [Rubroshorea leprosula]
MYHFNSIIDMYVVTVLTTLIKTSRASLKNASEIECLEADPASLIRDNQYEAFDRSLNFLTLADLEAASGICVPLLPLRLTGLLGLDSDIGVTFEANFGEGLVVVDFARIESLRGGLADFFLPESSSTLTL